MKAAFFYGGRDIRVEDVPDPVAGPGEVLVRVRAAGVCGSDLHGYRAGASSPNVPPRVRGHELAGDIVALGPDVTSLKVGQRVGVEPLVGCGDCTYCLSGAYHLCSRLEHIGGQRRGGFAELAVAPEDKVYPLSDGVSIEVGSLLDVYAVAVHALTQVPVRPGDHVAVIGTGAIGLSIAQMASLAGASVAVLGRRDEPLRVATQVAGAVGINVLRQDPVQAVRAWSGDTSTAGRGADRVYEAVGGVADTLSLALQLAVPRGTVGVVGSFGHPQTLDTGLALRRELTLAWIWSYAWREERPEFQIALDLLASGRLQAEPLITHRFPLERIREAFDVADRKAEFGSIKVLVLP